MAGRTYSTKKFSSVMDRHGNLDVKKLEKECGEGMYEDKRYRRVDDAKKKAIQVSRDYNEFRNFVSCAEDMLTPVSSTEFKELTKARAGWSHTKAARATKPEGSTRPSGEYRERDLAEGAATATAKKPPKTPLEFERDWRRCAKRPSPKVPRDKAAQVTQKRRSDYLRAQGPKVLGKIWKVELDATLMAQILDVVSRPWLSFDAPAEDAAASAAATAPGTPTKTTRVDEPPAAPDARGGPSGPPLASPSKFAVERPLPPTPPAYPDEASEPNDENAAPKDDDDRLAAQFADALDWFDLVATAPRFSLNALMLEDDHTKDLKTAFANLRLAATSMDATLQARLEATAVTYKDVL